MADEASLDMTGASQPVAIDDKPPALEVRGLNKSFAAVQALKDVSLSVKAGEVLALIGDNGAGKSTLVKCISGLLRPDSGEIFVDGESVTIDSPDQAQKLGIETVHQELMLVGTQDVAANLYLGRELLRSNRFLRMIRWLDKKAMYKGTIDVLERLSINIPSAKEQMDNLSGGQRQAVAVGRAVAWGKHIVLLDEPAAALGVEQSRHVLDLVQALAQQSVAVVFISHNMQHIMEACNTAYVLRHGEMVGQVKIDDVTATDLVDLITGAKRRGA